MAYFWVTEAQKYIQSLGFGTGTRRAVNKESQDLRINQWGADNSFSWDKKDFSFGKGGVDDAEDAEVIVHEYGHAIHDSQVAGFGVGSRRARSARGSATTGGDGRRCRRADCRTRRASPTGTRSPTRRPCRTACAASTPT